MFFLLPKVTLVLLAVFGSLVALRVWRQRHGSRRPGSRPRPRRRPPLWPRRAKARPVAPLLPASLLKGADRTWVVFITSDCLGCRDLAGRLRAAQPDAEVTEVDCARQPRLAERFLVRQHPTVLVANRYGQVESRLVGTRAVDDAINALT